MKSWLEEMNGQGSRLSGLVVWSVAAVAVLGAHAAGAAYLLRERPEPLMDDAAPALMLELSPISEAVNTDQNNAADQLQDSAEVKPQETEPEPEEVVEEEPLPEPEPEPEDVVEEIDVPVEQPAVVIPKIRPERKPKPEPKVVEKKEPPKEIPEKPKKKREPPPSVAQNRAAAQVQQSDRNRGMSGGGGGGSAQNAKWNARLNAHLQRHKRNYSGTARRDVGTAQVRFTIDDAGNVLSVSLAKSSGLPGLDENALSTVRRSSPVPPPPPENSQRTFVVPMKFDQKSFR
ncbi:energy transducer TonB family protein [Paenirhodobacter sp.]|uniref:energy transducer TonB family protein n=1 Tax=Paenirhodobacter sp. TaxID=1965326 RepID=UPI003B3DDDBC